MRGNRISLRAALLGCGSALLMGGAAYAQDAAEPPTIGEVIVTALRASENIQSVPVAVTAFDEQALEKQSIVEVRDVQFHVPNVRVREEAGVGGLTIGIRGISVSAENFSLDTAVGVYMNEVFIARSNDFSGSFFDVDRLQVLRGPQGTLYGRNTPAGALLIESKRPGTEYGGYAKVGLGGGGWGDGADRTMYRFEGAVDLPFTDTFAVRVAGFHEEDDGWARSRFTGYENNSRNDTAVRATATFKPTDNFDATLIVDHSIFKRGAPLWVPLQRVAGSFSYQQLNGGTAVQDAVDAEIADGLDPFETNHELDHEKNKGESTSATLLLSYDINERWQVRSITGWRDIERRTYNESDSTRFPSQATPSVIAQTQISQELVFSGELTEKLNFVGGLFYFKETGLDENTILYNVTNPGTPGAFVDPLQLRGEDFENTSQAVFLNFGYDILPTLTASLGYRYTQEEKSVYVNSRRTVSNTILAVGLEEFDDTVSLYDVRLDWQATPDLLLYAKYGTGYRAGGIGFRAADAQFEPEEVATSELGAKWDFNVGGIPVRLNMAAFYSEYENFQIPVVLSGPTRQTIINAGAATIQGAEFELTVKPTSNLTISSSLGLLDAAYDEFAFTNLSLGGLIDLTDNEMREAPDVTFSTSVGYEVPSSIGQWLFQVDYAYTSDYEADTVFQTGAPTAARTTVFHQDATSVWNGRVKLGEAFGSRVDLSVWGKNLTDEKRLVYVLHSAPMRTGVFSEPMSYGIELRAAF